MSVDISLMMPKNKNIPLPAVRVTTTLPKAGVEIRSGHRSWPDVSHQWPDKIVWFSFMKVLVRSLSYQWQDKFEILISTSTKYFWKQQKMHKMQFSRDNLAKKWWYGNMKKGTGDMPKIRQNTKNQPYMTNQCLWKPELKPEKMDYGKRLSIPGVRALFGKKWNFLKHESHLPNKVPSVKIKNFSPTDKRTDILEI